MPRQDDLAISGGLYLLRRIPPWAERVQWDSKGLPSPSSQNFKDPDQELSTDIERETTLGHILQGHADFGVVRFTANQVRDVCGQAAILCRDPPPPSHVLICGKLNRKMLTELKSLAAWVWIPARLDPITGQRLAPAGPPLAVS